MVTLGHAIVDVLAPSDDALVAGFGLEKGTMTLIDERQAETIYAALGPATEASGGSAANTAACLASLGGSVQFIGKVRDDDLGRVFIHDIRAAGVEYSVAPAGRSGAGPGTGRCLIMVTPDAEKTMCTNLGIGAQLSPYDVDVAAIRAARVLYLEGYLIGAGFTDAAAERAVTAAGDAGVLVALSLSDPAWVGLRRKELDAVLDAVDLLFANEQEACGLTDQADAAAAAQVLSRRCRTVAVTRGALGSIVATGTEVVSVPAAEVTRWSTPRAPATATRPASCTGWSATGARPTAPGSAPWPRPRSSATSAPDPCSRWPLWPPRPGSWISRGGGA